MSNLTTSASVEGSVSIGTNYPRRQQYFAPLSSTSTQSEPVKKKRNLPGNPDPDAEVIVLSPTSLLTTNRFICEICNKGFKRDQNLQLHRRGHNLPWKLKQRTSKEVRKKVYVCPEPTCVHHDPSRALGDLTGIKKHFCRKHGEKKWKCDKCSKRYAVQSDWKAHSKTCGTREYRCDCGTLFSRRDSFITHRAFCDALAEESARTGNPPLLPSQPHINNNLQTQFNLQSDASFPLKKEQQQLSFTTLRPEIQIPPWLGPPITTTIDHHRQPHLDQENPNPNPSSLGPTTLLPAYQLPAPSPHMSATALLQKAAQMGATISKTGSPMLRTHNSHVSASNSAGFDLSSSPEDHVTMTTHGFLAPFSYSSAPPPSDQFGGANSFEEALIGGILNPTKDANLHDSVLFKTTDPGSRRNGVAEDGAASGNEGLTRDFLGLKSLSQNDILSIAGIGNCMSSSSSSHDQRIHQLQWQG